MCFFMADECMHFLMADEPCFLYLIHVCVDIFDNIYHCLAWTIVCSSVGRVCYNFKNYSGKLLEDLR